MKIIIIFIVMLFFNAQNVLSQESERMSDGIDATENTTTLESKAEYYANLPAEKQKGVSVGNTELEANKRYSSYNPLLKSNEDSTKQGKDFGYKLTFYVIVIIALIVLGFLFALYFKKQDSTNEAENVGKYKEMDATKILSELQHLQSLRSNGAITEEEFESLKKKIIA
jgi:uncharacterized membrane protein